MASAFVWVKDYDKAILEAEKAVSLGPSSASAHHALGIVLDWAGRPQEVISFFENSLGLSPVPIETTTLTRLGSAYHQLGQYEEAVAIQKKALPLYGEITCMPTYSWLLCMH